ncbi:MAG: hypothetical protein IPM39_07410 [Chloroflexi bacterium]|nr:hypothetical protein [Chloroflexota bacterium]
MQSTTQFSGLTMPVFTAFGWAGEETAIKYALAQLELFIAELHRVLPRQVQERFPHHGLNKESQLVYLSTAENASDDIAISFFARPMSLELQLTVSNEAILTKIYRQAEKEPALCHRLITEIGPEWSLRVQQTQVDADSQETAHYQDLFKDSVAALDEATSMAVMSKASYLNSDPRWLVPLYLSRRFESERVAAMGTAVTQVLSEQVARLMPVLDFLTGKTARKKPRPKTRVRAIVETAVDLEEDQPDTAEMFTYVAELKPLHLRQGFINLTPKHWPFFQVNSRTETRPVTVYYEGIYDKECSVWRLLPDDRARLVLSPSLHEWLEENFTLQDQIHVTARKLGENEIQISLRAVKETTE